jgi:uncharacterized RDD family membrane protein YckC
MPPPAVAPAGQPPVSWQPAPAASQGIAVPGSAGVFFASTWTRFAAWIVDSLVLLVFDIVVAAVVSVAIDGVTRTAVTAIAGVAISAAYFVPLWRGDARATLGMRAFSIQIGNAFDGAPLTRDQAIRRWAAMGYPLGLLSALTATAGIGVILSVILLVALLLTTLSSITRQGFHDTFANTAVVRRPGAGGSNTAAVVIVIVMVVILFVLVPFIALIFLGSQLSDILSQVGNSI